MAKPNHEHIVLKSCDPQDCNSLFSGSAAKHSHHFVHLGGVGFFGAFFHVGDADAERLFAEGDLDDVADFDIVGRLDDTSVDADVRRVTRIICHGAALDQARHL